MLRLAPGDHRREEDPGGDERRRDPEDRELDVPGAHQVVREDLGEVEAEEAGELGAVVLRWPRRPASGAGTAPAITKKNQRRRALRRRQRDVAGRAERERRLLAPVPAETQPQRPKTREQEPDAAEQRDQREHATRRARSRSACCRRAAPAASCSCRSSRGRAGSPTPPRPSSAKNAVSCRSSVAVGDRVRAQPVLGRRVGEEARCSAATSSRNAAACAARERQRAGRRSS